jgi:hypothetical protein
MNGVGNVTVDKLPDTPFLSSQQKLGLVFFLFSSVVLLIIFKKSSSSNQYYEIDQTGILCEVGTLSDKIAFQEIESVKKISNDQAKDLAIDFYEKCDRGEKDPTGDAYSEGELICYSISPFTVQYTKYPGSARKVDIKARGDFLLMTLKNGKKFFLSPDEKDKFLEIYDQRKV